MTATPSHRIRAREPRGPVESPPSVSGDDVARYLTDASRYPGGECPRVYLPSEEGQVAWVLRNEERVLAVGAQSSLTGGATPQGDALLATERMTRLGPLEGDRIRAQPGVALVSLQEAAREQGAFYPPAPTYDGAYVGGTISTNAAGAATFKYGSTRQWVEGLTVVLADGHVLQLRRGEVVANPEGTFEVELPDGSEPLTIPVPSYVMPDVPKRSAGYHAAPGMDLIDLFIGSEGTLGVVVEAELRVLSPEPPVLVAFTAVADEARGIELVARLRAASHATWADPTAAGLDVRSIECIDRRCIELLREEGQERVGSLAEEAALALFVMLDLPADLDANAALEGYADDDPSDTPVKRLFDLLAEFDALDEAELALPGDRATRESILAVREAVPVAVNHRVAAAKRDIDERIHKAAADMIVPFERFAEAQAVYREELGSRGIDHAIWGHISDGNVHPNVIPTSYADVQQGYEAFLACGKRLQAMGGCPLSEHGTGRNAMKQGLLRGLYGDEGIAQMRAVKRALDPKAKLARGVIFPADA